MLFKVREVNCDGGRSLRWNSLLEIRDVTRGGWGCYTRKGTLFVVGMLL